MLEYDNNYIRRLIQLDLIGGLSPEEKGKLEDWINESEEHRLLFCKIKKQKAAIKATDWNHPALWLFLIVSFFIWVAVTFCL